MECVEADLVRAGYRVDAILGHVDRTGAAIDSGVDALVQLVQKLTTNQHGVIYFTHGAEINDHLLKLEMGAINEADRKRITGDGSLDSDAILKLEATIRDRVLTQAGLPQDDERLPELRA